MVGPSRPSAPISFMISRWKCSWRLASSTRGISFSWQKSRALSRSMRSSSLSSASSSNGSCQSKAGFSLDRDAMVAAACGVIVFTPRPLGPSCRLADAVLVGAILVGAILVGDKGGGLDLDLGAVLDQRDDLDQRHRREMAAECVAPGATDRRQAGEIFVLVGDVPGHPRDVLGSRTGRGEHRDGVAQRLLELADEIVRGEDLCL